MNLNVFKFSTNTKRFYCFPRNRRISAFSAMDKGQMAGIVDFINHWNMEFPHYTLTVDDLKNPQGLIEALFMVFDKLGINRDFFLAPPEESNESSVYYRDLLPVINMTRALNHLMTPQNEFKITIMHFLQPTVTTSRTILHLPFNLMVFYEERLNEIRPQEQALFAKTEHVKTLESRKNMLREMLNKQAQEKGKRAERLEMLGHEVKQLEEELKNIKEVNNEEKQKLEAIRKENQQTEVVIDHKKSQRDAILTEVARKKALRVYDSEDIRAQAEQASQNVQEAEEKLNTLRSTLMQKENSLKNLQTIKPSLDTANNLLHEIMKLKESLKDFESGDLDTDSKEGELEVLNTELSELQVQLSELQAARAEATDTWQESQAKRQSDKSQALSTLREAEEKDKKCRSRSKIAAQQTDELKQLTLKYDAEKTAGLEELASMVKAFAAALKSVEDVLIKKTKEVEKRIEEKLLQRNL